MSEKNECPQYCPQYYSKGGIEPWEYMQAKMTAAEYIGYLKGNIIKYISRAGLKGEAHKDYKKAAAYCAELVRFSAIDIPAFCGEDSED